MNRITADFTVYMDIRIDSTTCFPIKKQRNKKGFWRRL